MQRLERISPPASSGPWVLARIAPPGRLRHCACENLPRHRHREAFAALVLKGGYVEAGDTGRHVVQAGDVVLHRAFESHLDRIGGRGAEVLVLPWTETWKGPALARLSDPDSIARLASRDPRDAAAALAESLEHRTASPSGWPDILAAALRADPCLGLAGWAETMGLHLGSVSRGFRRIYGVTPAAFRLTQRALRAVEALLTTEAPTSAVAQTCGFADQAHMTRAVSRLTDTSPCRLRRTRQTRGQMG